jgi:hypothetical protein
MRRLRGLTVSGIWGGVRPHSVDRTIAASFRHLCALLRRRKFDFGYRHRKQIAAARDRLEDFLVIVIERCPDIANALHQRIVRDEGVGPDRLDQFVLSDDSARIAREVKQHIEGFVP